MLDFVVCDDNEGLRRSVSNIIDSFMMKNNYAYKIKLYSDYNEKFMKEIDSFNRQKIYIGYRSTNKIWYRYCKNH